jgi:hypothetical protein
MFSEKRKFHVSKKKNRKKEKLEIKQTKIECPVCGNVGVLEQRGNSQRVVYYKYVDGKRVFTKHTIKGTGAAMGTNKQDLCSNGVLSSYGGSRRGARGPLYRKPSIRRAESLGEASKIARLP